jgi:hypothetical protein
MIVKQYLIWSYAKYYQLFHARIHSLEPVDMVRNNGLTVKDWHPDDGGGIHLVLQKRSDREN